MTMFEIGTTLREARERRHLTHDDVEAETKIRAKYVRALEEEEFALLPSGTYVKGFLRTYADFLGLDGQIFVDEYVSRFGTKHDDDLFRRRRERPQPMRRESSNALVVAIVAVVALSVLVFVAWRWGPDDAPPREVTPNPPTQTGPPAADPRADASTVPTETIGAPTVRLAVRIYDAPAYALIRRLSDGRVAKRCDPSCPVGTAFQTSDPLGFELQLGNRDAIELKINETPFRAQAAHVWATLDGDGNARVLPTAPVLPTG